MKRISRCRFCDEALATVFVDLGTSPPSNSFLSEDQITAMERHYPLRVFVCGNCFLVQLEEFESPKDIFSDYVYFSSYSSSWLEHCRRYVDRTVEELKLGPSDHVVEIASNDGYLLQFFKERGIPVLGIEPAANVAEVAVQRGIPSDVAFFGTGTASRLRLRGHKADLMVANNVLAHVPDINDFVEGIHLLLADRGTITLEFPHLLQLIEHTRFDTIYHEHFSYLSLLAVDRIFATHGLRIFRVEELPTHGGSLRIWAMHAEVAPEPEASVAKVLADERAAKLDDLETYSSFQRRVEWTKRRLLEFLIGARDEGKSVAAYGAAAKGTTLLNYCGIRTDFVEYVVDRNPHKQNTYVPGCHVPVYAPERIDETKPDYVLILPWNLRDEISRDMAHIRDWGGKFVVPIPEVEVF